MEFEVAGGKGKEFDSVYARRKSVSCRTLELGRGQKIRESSLDIRESLKSFEQAFDIRVIFKKGCLKIGKID